MLSTSARISMLVLGLAVLIFVINMVRIRRLREQHALLWVLAGLGLTAAPIFSDWLDLLGQRLGFEYTPALLLFLAVVALLLVIFQLSLTISKHSDHLKTVIQELGLLRQELESLKAARRLDDAREADR